MLIISVDPGNVTGVDLYMKVLSGKVIRSSFELDSLLSVSAYLRETKIRLGGWHDPVHLAVEEYTMTGGGGAKTPQPTALKIMGVTEDLADQFNWVHHYYAPTTCKRRCDNATLRQLGWWSPTKDGHINDARRVTLTCMAHVFPEEFARLRGI